MKKGTSNSTHEFLKTENAQLQKLHDLVEQSIREEELITQQLAHPKEPPLSLGERLSDRVAEFGGSWRFIITFLSLMFVWISANVYLLANRGFDPYPFILLNLILSCIAALQAPIIMMSQNRVEDRDRRRAENDYAVNLKAEIEIRSLHQKLDLLISEQIKTLFEIQEAQLRELEHLKKHMAELHGKLGK